nr:unnamed protein product [Callosobruchus chinensis]
MHTRNFFFSPQVGRSSYIKNRTIRPHFYPQGVQCLEWTAWVPILEYGEQDSHEKSWRGSLENRKVAFLNANDSFCDQFSAEHC